MSETVKPYSPQGSKKEQVAGMFNNIAGNYDFLNHFLSLNIDKIWRRKLIRFIAQNQPKQILDIATGTGDLAIAALRIHPDKVHGIDISEGMLAVGQQKITDRKLSDKIILQKGDAENIPFQDDSFDALTVAFGARNFEDLNKGLQEMYRVCRPGGVCAVLEFSMPKHFPVKQLYTFYFKYILPVLGKLVSKDQSAYTYLPESVQAFPQYEAFTARMEAAGFSQCHVKTLSMGIACIYLGYKQS